MGHVQHLSPESLVKMDHFQKEPPRNLKETTGALPSIADIDCDIETSALCQHELPQQRRAVLGIFGFAPCEALAALTTISCAGH
jgi:hypothetical protein